MKNSKSYAGRRSCCRQSGVQIAAVVHVSYRDVIAEADRGKTACQLYLEQQPDVMVMDLSMPGIGGLETIRRILLRDSAARILVFSIHDERVYVNRALSAGVKG